MSEHQYTGRNEQHSGQLLLTHKTAYSQITVTRTQQELRYSKKQSTYRVYIGIMLRQKHS